jgi:S1-C subfamily serine protease
MIQRVLAQAGLRRGPKKTTGYYVALVEDRLRTSARRTWLVLGLIAVLIAGGIALSVTLVWRKPNAPVYQNTAFNYGEPVGTGIAASNRFNVFLLAGDRGAGLEGFCTAFAVSSNLLATNAHCVREAQGAYRGIVALMNGTAGRSYSVTRTLAHPGYVQGQLSPDVGLLEVAGPLPTACTLAQGPHLGSLAVGSTIFVYGFPARLSTLVAPEATFTRGEVGRLTTLSLVPGDSSTNVLIQHSAFISGGTSGSPMFDAQGRVVGINAGGYAQSGTTLTGYNYGIRIDVVMPLFASFGMR